VVCNLDAQRAARPRGGRHAQPRTREAHREVVQARVDLSPTAPFVKHTRPGKAIVYVLGGTLEYQVEGQPPTTLQAGDVLLVPAATIHGVKNAGSGNAAELATYVVEKGKPILTLVE
jgi:quercetin dioxygenase-like cupin family protein